MMSRHATAIFFFFYFQSVKNPNMNDKKLEEEEERKHHRSLSQKWTAFIENTTLHGIRNVLPSQRPNVSRVVWSVVMLTFGAYFIYTFYKAVNKYLQYHTVTSITKNYEQNMSFPAVSICPDNLFSRRKIMMRDDDPFFAAQGLNMSACEVTRELRQREMNNMSCGSAAVPFLDIKQIQFIIPTALNREGVHCKK